MLKKILISFFISAIFYSNASAAAGTPAAVAACSAATKGATSGLQILTRTITTINKIIYIDPINIYIKVINQKTKTIQAV